MSSSAPLPPIQSTSIAIATTEAVRELPELIAASLAWNARAKPLSRATRQSSGPA